MKKEDYFLYAGIVFGLAGLLHLWRSINSWSLILGSYEIPLWVSYLAVIVTGYMAYTAYKFRK